MRYVSYLRNQKPGYGLLVGDGIIDLGRRIDAPDLKHALERSDDMRACAGESPDFPVSEITFLPPIPNPDKVFCCGLNYATHLLETGKEQPKHPTIFTRTASAQVGHGQALVRPAASEHFDFEGELAVVIGTRCRHVPRERAFSVLAGYSCFNDGSVRDWQRHSSQFTPGKNFEKSGAFGPAIVTVDEIADIGREELITRLNGQEVQRARIDDLVFDIADLVSYCSTFSELLPGDVIVTGTSGGVGAFRTPPLWMKPGDRVEVEITNVGRLENDVIHEMLDAGHALPETAAAS